MNDQRPSRADRFAAFVAKANDLAQLAGGPKAHILRVLGALTESDIRDLGEWNLDRVRCDAIIQRVAATLEDKPSLVEQSLSRFLRCDLWTDYGPGLAEWRAEYLASGVEAKQIAKFLSGLNTGTCWCTYGMLPYYWEPGRAAFAGLTIEDNRWYRLCVGYLTANSRGFPNSLDLLEGSFRQSWTDWQVLWGRYF